MADPKPLLDPLDYDDVAIDDDDNPEWTKEDFARARPAREVLPPEVYAALTSGRVEFKPAREVTLTLPPEVVAHYESQGPDWRDRMAATLTERVRPRARG